MLGKLKVESIEFLLPLDLCFKVLSLWKILLYLLETVLISLICSISSYILDLKVFFVISAMILLIVSNIFPLFLILSYWIFLVVLHIA
jgi:hypothetical protein